MQQNDSLAAGQPQVEPVDAPECEGPAEPPGPELEPEPAEQEPFVAAAEPAAAAATAAETPAAAAAAAAAAVSETAAAAMPENGVYTSSEFLDAFGVHGRSDQLEVCAMPPPLPALLFSSPLLLFLSRPSASLPPPLPPHVSVFSPHLAPPASVSPSR